MSSVPGGRYEHAYQDDIHPNADIEAELKAQPEAEYDPIRVQVIETGKGIQGAYKTVVIPVSTSTVAGYAQLLPRDPSRTRAYIMPVDYPIVIATSLAEVQNVANVGATFPNGGFLGNGNGFSPPIESEEAVYASNTSTAGTCRVVVIAEHS